MPPWDSIEPKFERNLLWTPHLLGSTNLARSSAAESPATWDPPRRQAVWDKTNVTSYVAFHLGERFCFASCDHKHDLSLGAILKVKREKHQVIYTGEWCYALYRRLGALWQYTTYVINLIHGLNSSATEDMFTEGDPVPWPSPFFFKYAIGGEMSGGLVSFYTRPS